MSTPIETNTEELQEILQTVYNLPNAGGSAEPDLVIEFNMSESAYVIDDIVNSDFAVVGNVGTVKAKILNNEIVNIVMKYNYHYGSSNFTGTAVPFQFGYNEYYEVVHADFILYAMPGHAGNARYFVSLQMEDDGTLSVSRSNHIRVS